MVGLDGSSFRLGPVSESLTGAQLLQRIAQLVPKVAGRVRVQNGSEALSLQKTLKEQDLVGESPCAWSAVEAVCRCRSRTRLIVPAETIPSGSVVRPHNAPQPPSKRRWARSIRVIVPAETWTIRANPNRARLFWRSMTSATAPVHRGFRSWRLGSPVPFRLAHEARRADIYITPSSKHLPIIY